MKIEIKTSHNSIKLLSADEVLIKMCREILDDLVEYESEMIKDRKSAIEFFKNCERTFAVYQEERDTFIFEIKTDWSKLISLCNKIVNSKIMQQMRKVVITIIKDVFIKLMVEIVLSLIHGYKGMYAKKQFALT